MLKLFLDWPPFTGQLVTNVLLKIVTYKLYVTMAFISEKEKCIITRVGVQFAYN